MRFSSLNSEEMPRLVSFVRKWFIEIIFGTVLASVIAILITRGFVFSSGYVESIDVIWTTSPSVWWRSIPPWNFFASGDYSVLTTLQVPALYFLVAALTNNMLITEHYVFFATFFVMALSMFTFSTFICHKLSPRGLGILFSSSVAAFSYCFSPILLNEVFHITFLWAYALIPSIALFAFKCAEARSNFQRFLWAGMCAVCFANSADPTGMLIEFIIVLLILAGHIAGGRYSGIIRLKSVLTSFVMFVGLSIAFGSYWLIPYLAEPVSNASWNRWENLVQKASQFSPSSVSALMLGLQPSYPYFTTPAVLYIIEAILVSVAIFGIILIKSRLSIIFGLMVLIGLLVGKGISPPFGSAYEYILLSKPLGLPIYEVLLQYPSRFLVITSVGASVLLSAVCVKILNFRNRYRLFGYAISLFLLLAPIQGSPLLSGDVGGAFSPVSLPSEYLELHDWLSSQSGNFRVIWFPEDAFVTWSNPLSNKLDYWASPTPTVLYGWGTTPSPGLAMIGNMAYDLLKRNATTNIGMLLALANVKYVIFHSDTIADYTSLLNTIERQNDLRLVFSNRYLKVFENLDFNPGTVFSTNTLSIVVGGMDVLQNMINGGIPPNSLSPVFMDDAFDRSQFVRSVLNSADLNYNVIFYNGRTFIDLVLNSLPSQFLINPSQFAGNGPPSSWDVNFVQSFNWAPIILAHVTGEKYDLSLFDSFAYTQGRGKSLVIPIKPNQTNTYSIWVRALVTPYGGSIMVSMDGFSRTYDTKSNTSLGFRWFPFSNQSLSSTTHTLKIMSDGGLNAVDAIAIVPASSLEYFVSQASLLLNRSSSVLHISGDKPIDNQMGLIRSTVNILYTGEATLNFHCSLPQSSGPVVVLTESFSPFWSTSLPSSQFRFAGVYNGYILGQGANESKNRIGFYYIGQTYLVSGVIISIFSLMIFTASILRQRIANKLRIE
jgi:hypothetical protein